MHVFLVGENGSKYKIQQLIFYNIKYKILQFRSSVSPKENNKVHNINSLYMNQNLGFLANKEWDSS